MKGRAKGMVDICESQRKGCYLCVINRLVSPRELSWSVAEGFRYNLAVKFWFLSCCQTCDRTWACSTGHVKDITFVPLPEEKQKAMDNTQYHSVWFYYRKSHKTYLCKASLWYLQHIQCQSFCPLFELTMEKLLLAGCESFDSSLQVNCCFSWTDCWWLFLLFLSHKDNFIWRNLSCTQCAGLLHLFSAESTWGGIKGT